MFLARPKCAPRLVHSATLILSIAWPMAVWASTGSAQDAIAPIVDALKSKRYAEALIAAKLSLQRNPGEYRVWTLEGMALEGEGDSAEAVAAYKHALSLEPNYLPALKAQARLLYGLRDPRVVPVLRQLMKLNPADQAAREMLAVADARQNECSSAIAGFEALKETVQTHPESMQWYGYCLTRDNRLPDAAAVFASLVKLLPSALEPRFDLALVQMRQNQYHEAFATLQPLIAAGISDPDLLSLASEAYESSGDTPAAVSLLRRAIQADPDNSDLYVRFAGLCLSHDSFSVGIDIVNAGLARIPGNEKLYIARGLLYGQMGKYEDAEHDLQIAEKMNPAATTSSYVLAATAMQHGDLDRALETVRHKLADHPRDFELRYMLAKILVNQGAKPGSPEFEEALNSAGMAVNLKPDSAPAHDLLASLYLDEGKMDLAETQSRLAIAADPEDQSAIYHLIAALRGSGQKVELQGLVKKLLALQHKSSQQPTTRERYKIMERGTPEETPNSTSALH